VLALSSLNIINNATNPRDCNLNLLSGERNYNINPLGEKSNFKGKILRLESLSCNITVLESSFSLKSKVASLKEEGKALEVCEKALEVGLGTQDRLRRVAIVLLILGLVALGIGLIVIGGNACITIGILLAVFVTIFCDVIFSELVLGRSIEMNILAPITGPCFLIYYYAITYESKLLETKAGLIKKLDASKNEIVTIANYIEKNKRTISELLTTIKREIVQAYTEENFQKPPLSNSCSNKAEIALEEIKEKDASQQCLNNVKLGFDLQRIISVQADWNQLCKEAQDHKRLIEQLKNELILPQNE
jgi:hypothetical protein